MAVNSPSLHRETERCIIHCAEKEDSEVSSALRRLLTNPSHFSQQSHIIGYVLAFLYMVCRVLLFSILVPYRDLKEPLPQATA